MTTAKRTLTTDVVLLALVDSAMQSTGGIESLEGPSNGFKASTTDAKVRLQAALWGARAAASDLMGGEAAAGPVELFRVVAYLESALIYVEEVDPTDTPRAPFSTDGKDRLQAALWGAHRLASEWLEEVSEQDSTNPAVRTPRPDGARIPAGH